MPHGCDGLAVALHLVAVFGTGLAGLEVDNPQGIGGDDDAVGAQHVAVIDEFGLALGGVLGVEETRRVGVGEESGEGLAQVVVGYLEALRRGAVGDAGEEVVETGAVLACRRVGGAEDVVGLAGDGDAVAPGGEYEGGELRVES